VTCREVWRLLDAYVDNELGPAESSVLQEHVAACRVCRERLSERESLGQLVRGIPYYSAPDRLRTMVLATSKRSRLTRTLLTWAAMVTLAVSVGGTLTIRSVRARAVVTTTTSIAESAVQSHVRALTAQHLFDVRSSDQHTVKPWFLGKLDFSPPVADVSSRGFELIGGRIDHVAGRSAAALVYQRRLHPINVFIWPAPDMASPSDVRTIRGFHVRHWIRDGMSFWAVSDLNDVELTEFVQAVQH
jgi:anti-sigma factor RsiW